MEFTWVRLPATVAKDLKPYWLRRYELFVEEGCLIWGLQVVIPTSGKRDMLEELHQADPGIESMN